MAALAGLAALQTDAGRTWLAASLSRALSSSNSSLIITGISGFVPSRLHVETIEAADKAGVWLAIEDAALELRLRDLLTGQFTLRRLSAASVTVSRSPQGQPEQRPSDPESFSLPRLPVRVAADAITIDRLQLGESLAGEAMTFALSARGALTGNEAMAQLTVERTDGAGHARLDFHLSRDRSLALHLDAAEPSGTVLQRVLARADPVPLRIAVHGDGALEDWRGRIVIDAGAEARIETAVSLAQRDALHVTSDGTVSAKGLLPPPLKELLTPVRITSAFEVVDTRLAIERLTIDSGIATVTASGAFDRRTAQFTGTAHTVAPDLKPLGVAFNLPLRGAAGMRLDARGTPDSPHVEVTLTATQFGGPIDADQLTAKLRGERRQATWSLHGSGEATGFVWPVTRPGLPHAIEWAVATQFDESAGRLTLERLDLRGGGVAIAASGIAEDLSATPRGHASINLHAPDLARWRDAAGIPLSGSLSLASEVELDAGAVVARITGRSQDLATGVAVLDSLIGARPDLNATVRRAADGALAVEALAIAGAHVTASASATTTADLSTLEARARIEAPRLDVLSDPLGAPMTGAASVQAHLTGSVENPTADIDAVAHDLRFGKQRLDRLSAKIALSDALSPAGTLAAVLNAGTLNATIDAAFARTSGETVDVPKLSVRAPGSELTGALKVRTSHPGASGTLTARIADLSRWSPLAGTALAGAVDARISLVEKDGQRADIDASIRNLHIDSAQAAAERIRIDAHLSDLLGRPAGRASVDASAVTLPDLRVDSLRANGQSTKPDLFAVSLDARGVLRPAADARPLRLSGASEISIGGAEQRIRVTRLAGLIGEHAIASHAPLTLALGANRFKMNGLDISVGKGRATASASREGNRLALQAQLRDMPLALVELAAPAQRVSGALDATIRMAATAAQPDGQMELSVRDMRMAAASELPPLALTSIGTWKGERLEATGQIAAPDGTKLDLSGTLPLKLDPVGLMPLLVRDGALRVAAKGDGRLEPWAALLPLGEDRLGGRYSINLAIGGTPAAPEPSGRLTIRDGHYVNFAAGTEIRNLAGEVAGEGGHFALRGLTASDGAKGSLNGSGSLDLAGGETKFEVVARFGNFGFMRRDDVTATGDGEFRFTGTTDAATLSGRLRVDRAEIRIPERLPPTIPRLPVVEIDSRSGEVLSKPDQASGGSAIALALDVEIPARAFVRGRGLDSEWRGAMRVAGTTAKPILTGKLETVRGDFSLLGKRFRLSDSTITFVGGERIDPQLAITAEHRAAAIIAQAVISGTASNPTLKLTSQPQMPDDEVLSRVLFGRSVGEMTPAQGLELAQAAATLAGGGPGILDRLRTATGLDRLDISSGAPGGAGDPSGTTATAGKYVSDRVFLGVEQGMKSDSTRSKVEVEITPNVTVESSLGSASAGVGVNWKWDY
ncbi:MAG TPA: translocation/assembly module TamB domain-containing protein [Alphaproteobacteria bacterium]|nr:translocation/assembly module TamB domain-containing protein [Alphaproteobacteria bacterium]